MTAPNMSAGAAAVDAFRKGLSGALPVVADQPQDEIAPTNPRAESISDEPNPVDLDAGYRLLEQDETDSGLPPDSKDEKQAALHAQLRGFDVIPLQQDGTPVDSDWRNTAMSDLGAIHGRWASGPRCKVGGITSGLIVLRVSPEGLKQIEALAGGKRTPTAAVHPYGDKPPQLMFFRLPEGSSEGNISLAPGVDVLPDAGYIELPSGNLEDTDTCYWVNRRPIADAPPWLTKKLEALGASQQTNRSAGAAEIADAEKDTSEIVQQPARSGSIDLPDKAHKQAENAQPTAKPAGNTDMALGFLDGLDSSGRHDLAVFDPSPDCATFLFPNEREKAGRWIDAWQGKASIYASVNRAREDAPRNKRLDHKKEKEIGSVRAIVADIDISDIKSDDLNEKRQHFQKLKTKLLEEVVPEIGKLECPPSTIIDSGGGVQLWWRLKEAMPTSENGDKAEGIGRAIRERLQAIFPEYKPDPVFDLPRVMRLPGTINIPDEKKRKRGRSAAPATVLIESQRGYSLDELAAWATPTTKPQSSSSNEEFRPIAEELNAQWDVIRAASCYDELPANLREKFESACERDPALRDVWNGNPIRVQTDESPSGFMFAFAERLVRDKRFTVIEFGRLLWVCEDIYPDNNPVKVNPRALSRAWGKRMAEHAARSSASDFEKVQIDESKAPRAKAKSKSDESEHAKAESKGAAWDEPADLWADAADPPDLALGVLPPALERWAKDEAERKGVDLGVMAVPAVVVCAAAIPAQFQLQVKQADTGHKTRGILWGAIVGDPGVRKSPVLAAAKAPMEAAEAEWKRRNRILDEEYKKNLAAWKRSVKEGGEEPEPVPPKRLRKMVMDATTEALGLILNDNPAGLLEYQDELSQWIGSMDAYRSNKPVSRDQGFWLAAKEGNSSVVDRAGRGTLAVDITAIHILGGVQPSVIRKVVSEWGGNGLMQRFLLVMAKTAGKGIDRAPDSEASATIRAAICALMELTWSPFIPSYRFSREADEWRQKVLSFARGYMTQVDTPLPLKGWLEKLEGEWARLCLVFHFIEWATDTRATPFPPEIVTTETAIRAARFLIEFQYPHQQAFYRSVGLGEAVESDAQWIGGYILAHQLTEIDERDIGRACRRLEGPTKRAARLEAAQALAEANWLRPIGEHRTMGHVNRWSVHPAVHGGRFAAKSRSRSRAP
jgi:hypothetical protein